MTRGNWLLWQPAEARATIRRVLAETEGVAKDPGPWVYVAELASSVVNFDVYFWVKSPQADLLAVRDQVATGIKLALDRAGIDLPYPHTVVLFHGATGSRDGDIERTGYLSARGEESSRRGGGAEARRYAGGAT